MNERIVVLIVVFIVVLIVVLISELSGRPIDL